MHTDTQREIDYPAPVGHHRSGTATCAGSKIRKEGRTAAQRRQFGQLGLHRYRIELRRRRRAILSDRPEHHRESLIEFRTEVAWRHLSSSYPAVRTGRI